MNKQDTCPHCGAEIQTAGDEYYLCWTNIKHPWHREECCYERQIAQKDEELDVLNTKIALLEDEVKRLRGEVK